MLRPRRRRTRARPTAAPTALLGHSLLTKTSTSPFARQMGPQPRLPPCDSKPKYALGRYVACRGPGLHSPFRRRCKNTRVRTTLCVAPFRLEHLLPKQAHTSTPQTHEKLLLSLSDWHEARRYVVPSAELSRNRRRGKSKLTKKPRSTVSIFPQRSVSQICLDFILSKC